MIYGEKCATSQIIKRERRYLQIVTLTEVIATLDSAAGKVKGVKANRERVDEVGTGIWPTFELKLKLVP